MSADTDLSNGRITGRNLDDPPDLLTVKELSEWAQVPVSTLYQWNFKEVGPRPMKFGKHLRYSREVPWHWMEGLDRHDWSSAS